MVYRPPWATTGMHMSQLPKDVKRPANVETYSREVETAARALARKKKNNEAGRRALADAVKRDADRIYDYMLAVTSSSR